MKKKNRREDVTNDNVDLVKKILFILLALVAYRLGSHIPLPGINTDVLGDIMLTHSKGMLGMFNVLTGGSLGRMSIFTLNIMPYITASIVMQLVTVISKEFADLRKSSEGARKMGFYTKALAMFLAVFQGYGITLGLEVLAHKGIALVSEPGHLFKLTATICLLSGTVIVIWLADQISSKNIGNGSSIIIFTGIVSGLIPSCAALFQMGRNGVISTHVILLCTTSVILLVAFIVFMETSEKRIALYHPRRQVGNKMYAGDNTHLPMKLNVAGVIPPIFASSLLLFPSTIAGFHEGSSLQRVVANYLAQGKPIYIVLYVFLMFFFCYFYSSIVFNPEETAENLKKSGCYIPGVRPGKNTCDYLKNIINRITFIGASYIALVCALPELIIANSSIPFYIGGTSVLIVVSVILDLSVKIRIHLLNQRYRHLGNKVNVMRLR